MSNEIILETVRELLPDIEKEIREQVNQELQIEYQYKFQQEIDSLALFNEEQIRAELEQQIRIDYEQQKEQLAQDVIREFDDSLQRGQLEQQLRFKIQEELEEQINEEVQKKSKQLKLQYKKRIEQEKNQLQKDFEQEWKQRVDAEKKRLEREKSEIARLKSVEYVKLKKLQDEQKKHSSLLKEQETKYQDIMKSLQKQIQELTQQLESALQDQITKEKLQNQSENFDILNLDKQMNIPFSKQDQIYNQKSIPIYQHKQITEEECQESQQTSVNLNNCKQQQNQRANQQQNSKNQKYLKKKQPTQYENQLEKGIKQQKGNMEIQKPQVWDQENNQRQMNRIDKIIKEYDEIPAQKEQFMSYNSLFKENDLDNSKNKQMKQLRQKVAEDQEKDQRLQTKYLGLQINIMNDFIVNYVEYPEYHQVKMLLQDIIELFNQWMISYQERIEFFKRIKQIANSNFRDIIPFLQTQIHKFKLIQNYYSDFQQRFNLKNQIMANYSQFNKCKYLFEQINQLNLKSINLSVLGCDFQEMVQLDQWEKDFLEREELKSQILCKIQSKLI
ncbi:unnamed protein product (macronuclear) [Paramecium tetraurelia]|uniref:Uncharacterized protein n=1 Tax=Paramecium tetraurelia TaxID=5888 RepID=A0DI21_PARTE|nr:uncharacterized protein GSPATT00017059001 [Paramecium tetraurelia]CAK82688.1 unnamed protein product [Paramecium tetraurelia]|eukprot:XP_001450085.1 hypothetical protein (macronuclear) [Paramecium tetraurelia strain d4-2]